MKSLKTSVIALSLPVVLASALAACGSEAETAEGGAKASLTFRTDFLPSGRYSAFYYAKEKGYYADEGLDVTIKTGKGSSKTAQDVSAGHSQIGMVDGSVAAISVGKNVPVKVVGMFSGRNQYGIFADKNAGAESIQDLEGKGIIVKPGTTQAVMLPGVMSAAGLKKGQYKTINIDPSAAQGAYNGGTGDALADDIAEATPAIKRESEVLPWVDTGLILPGYAFVAENEYAKNNEDEIAAFLKATYRGMDDAFNNPEAATEIVAKENPTVPKESIQSQFEAQKEYLCSDSMIESKDPIGYPNKDDWSDGLKALVEYADVPDSVSVDDIITDRYFTDPYVVSNELCGK